MWTTVVFSIFLVIFVDRVLSEGNVSSLIPSGSKISTFKADVHHILEGARIRVKRQLEGSDPLIHKFKFGKVTPVDLPYLSDLHLEFWLSIESRNQVLIGTTEGRVILFEILDNDENALVVALSEVEASSIKAKAFSYYDEQWFVVLHNSGSKFYIKLYQRVGRSLEKRQTIDLAGFSDMELITTKGMHYLVVATYSTTTNQGYSYQASVTLYYWAQTQFDAIASRVTYGARSLDCWIFDGSIYIAIGQEINDEGNIKVGSPIYLYNSKEENKLVLWEMLATYGPSKVRHFYVAENHYVIFIGRRDAIIYWWSSGQFLEWQTLQGTAHASDVSVLSIGDEVAIVIALKEEALFYTLDASGYYIISFTMSFKGSSLLSLQFMFSGKTYYALALFAESLSWSTWRLELESHYLPSVDSLDMLQQCLLDVQQKLAAKRVELEVIKADLKRVWRRGSNQTVKTKVIVKGRIISKGSRIKDVIILKYENIPHSSFSFVIAQLKGLGYSVEETKKELDGIVLKSSRQDIRGIKHFKDHIYVPSLRLESAGNDISINDVRISRLKNYALRKIGDQIIPSTTVIANIHAGMVNAGAINGISTSDLLLLSGRQFITGGLTLSDISTSSLTAETINSVLVEDVVTMTTPQIIKDLKTFSLLKSHSITVQEETNKVNLDNIRSKIATVDNYNEFMGHFEFRNSVTVNGSIFLTNKLNKVIDVNELASQSVNRDFQQDLTGFYSFKSTPLVTGDLLVTGSINGVSIDNLLTLDSNQKIYADTVFAEPLSVAHDLLVDSVNGVDIGEQALQKLPIRQFISGRKTFTKNIETDFVDMSEYITLDGVDPSFLVQDIIQHKQGILNHTFTTFKDVKVLGNVTALSGINGYNILDLPSSVWLKSVEQNISVPLQMDILHLKNDLQVRTVNYLDLENDIVSSYKNETVESSKIFQSQTVLKSLKTTGAVMINGIDPKSFKIKLDRYINEGTVKGRKTMDSLEIIGNLHVTKLNERRPSDIMYPDVYQIVHGSVEFAAKSSQVLGNIQSKYLSVDFFNDLNLHDYFRRAVTVASPIQLSNKYFSHLKGTDLAIPPRNKLAGVSLQDMNQRVVLLNIPQLITSKSFNSTVNILKTISASTVNGLELSRYLDKVVLTDEISRISHKQFLQDFQTTNAFVRGAINGINLQDMATDIFYKSEGGEIKQHFTFKGDIDLGDLSASVIDGVQWKDLVFLKSGEVLEKAWFLSNIHANRDVFITGSLNGCDLSQISSSVYTNKTTQVINKRVNVNTIVILGNLKVKNNINRIQFEVLQNCITTSQDQAITSNVVLEVGLHVENLALTDFVDSANIAFIIKDAVRHSIAQEIIGQKEFKENVNAASLAGGDLFVSKLDGIDLEELKQTSVSKMGYLEIDGDKIFPSLFMNVATISGFLNGLKLPQDVVKADVSEHIAHPTYFMSDVYVPTEIVVHGLVDGININELIQNRVTLNTEQNITAKLIFGDDIAVLGDLTIDGIINELVLELVAKVKSIHAVLGYKSFKELYVSGPVLASLVNGYDVSQLDSKILRYNKDDYINGIQVFGKTLHAQNSMYVEWINGISIRWLREAFISMMDKLKPVLGYLEDLSSKQQQQLINQLSLTKDKVLKFEYFTLHQEINVGPTTRILHGYDLQNDIFSHSLLLWTRQKHCIFMEKCCHLEFSYWLRVKKNGIVMVDESAESGRYYPILDPSPVLKNEESFIWTNSSDQPESCGAKNTTMFLGAYMKNSLKVFFYFQNAPQLSDVKSFRKDRLYAVAAFYLDQKHGQYGNTIVYAYDEAQYWLQHEILPSYGVLSLDIIGYTRDYRNDILLALGTGMDTVPVSYSSVYKWNNKNRSFEILQNIPSRYVTSTLWIRKESDLLLSLAGVETWPNKATGCSELVSGGQIDIYLYKEKLQWIQSIPVGGIVSMVSFSSDGDTYLAAASTREQNIYIFQWTGYSGFSLIQSISAEVEHLHVYTIDDDIYMTVASVSGPSKVLKMVRKGKLFSSTQRFDQTLERKYEDPNDSKIVTGC